ncbi:hypothetical protein LINPERPRIM_LOCUS16345 [Linum perenne]
MRFRFPICCIAIQIKKLMGSGFTIHVNAKMLPISLAGIPSFLVDLSIRASIGI